MDNTFEISSDIDILKRLGLTYDLGNRVVKNSTNLEDGETIVQMLPKVFQPYINQLIKSDKIEPILLDQSEFPNL